MTHRLEEAKKVPLGEDVHAYSSREVAIHVPDAWFDTSVVDPQDGGIGKVGYEINFNRYFCQYEPPRPLQAIEADIAALEAEIRELLEATE